MGAGRGATSAPLAARACRAACWSGGFDGSEQGERGVQIAGVLAGGGGHGADVLVALVIPFTADGYEIDAAVLEAHVDRLIRERAPG